MELSLRVGDLVQVEEKDKSYINSFRKYGYIIICYFLCGESEEVEVEQCREALPVERT